MFIQVLEGVLVLLIVSLALHGYGQRLMVFFFPSRGYDAGLSIVVGLSLFCLLTGPLEISCTASPLLFSLFLIAGLMLTIFFVLKNFSWPNFQDFRFVPVGLFILFGSLSFLFIINSAYWNYNFIDDRMGYLVFPRRVVMEGCIGRDAFHFRRIEVGLGGGGAYVYALFQAFVNVTQTRLADLGLGGLCLLLIIYGHTKELCLRPTLIATSLLIGLFVIVFSPIINNTPETLGKALLYALLRIVANSVLDTPSMKRGALIALLFCCLALLKTSFLPPAIAIVTTFYGILAYKGMTASLIKEGAFSAILVFFFLSPWMLVSYNIADTLWYPLLGTGSLGDAEVAGLATREQFLRDGGRLAVIMVAPCITAFLAWRYRLWSKLPLVMIIMPLAIALLILVSQAKFTIFGYRYGHMGAATVFLFYLVISLSDDFRKGYAAYIQRTYQFLILILLFSNNTLGYRWFDDGWLAYRFQNRDIPADIIVLDSSQTPNYQAAVPTGRHFLALIPWPSILDFQRNPISIMDWPGMMGPQGMPDLNDARGWQKYLSDLGIEYIIYSYGNEVGYRDFDIERDIIKYSEPARFSQYQIDLVTNFRSVKHLFSAMKDCSSLTYDDGIVAVLEVRLIRPNCLSE
jgi:hypothetical protein